MHYRPAEAQPESDVPHGQATSKIQPARERAGEEPCAPLAAVVHRRGFDLDGVLADACVAMRASGLRLGGILQLPGSDCGTKLNVVDLAAGGTYGIWQDLGACSEGCRLDERGLAEAVPAVLAALAGGVDLIVINRFGKAESHGGGMIVAITAALEAGVPVLTAVREPYVPAWRAFHGGLGQELEASADAVLAWSRGAIPSSCNT